MEQGQKRLMPGACGEIHQLSAGSIGHCGAHNTHTDIYHRSMSAALELNNSRGAMRNAADMDLYNYDECNYDVIRVAPHLDHVEVPGMHGGGWQLPQHTGSAQAVPGAHALSYRQ